MENIVQRLSKINSEENTIINLNELQKELLTGLNGNQILTDNNDLICIISQLNTPQCTQTNSKIQNTMNSMNNTVNKIYTQDCEDSCYEDFEQVNEECQINSINILKIDKENNNFFDEN